MEFGSNVLSWHYLEVRQGYSFFVPFRKYLGMFESSLFLWILFTTTCSQLWDLMRSVEITLILRSQKIKYFGCWSWKALHFGNSIFSSRSTQEISFEISRRTWCYSSKIPLTSHSRPTHAFYNWTLEHWSIVKEGMGTLVTANRVLLKESQPFSPTWPP